MFLSRNSNKIELCNRIYYSTVYWSLNMFRVAHRSSSIALNCICSLRFICPYGDRPLPRISLELLMMSGVPLETCWAFKKLRNNKFYYKAASCWYFYWVIYDARIHEYQISQMFHHFAAETVSSNKVALVCPPPPRKDVLKDRWCIWHQRATLILWTGEVIQKRGKITGSSRK
jgi:hypothetical protein